MFNKRECFLSRTLRGFSHSIEKIRTSCFYADMKEEFLCPIAFNKNRMPVESRKASF